MAGVNQVQFRVREISSIGVSPFDCKERIVLPPKNQHFRLSAAEVLMPVVIKGDVRLIVAKQIELNGGILRTIKKELVQRVGIRIDSAGVVQRC